MCCRKLRQKHGIYRLLRMPEGRILFGGGGQSLHELVEILFLTHYRFPSSLGKKPSRRAWPPWRTVCALHGPPATPPLCVLGPIPWAVSTASISLPRLQHYDVLTPQSRTLRGARGSSRRGTPRFQPKLFSTPRTVALSLDFSLHVPRTCGFRNIMVAFIELAQPPLVFPRRLLAFGRRGDAWSDPHRRVPADRPRALCTGSPLGYQTARPRAA
jgi:hypothetical protein